ncbi:glycogenin glucosyltransferase [Friedmanniomyces endolithicus]|uniref:glycogenin glucosyltransferase n=1 Tax=Friedmanniomyces endolithicus TaxID=329885 RepID=A0AAN6KR95_9PEZI|nr:glycogenin glucosyltransferase [Friedmanniomyces endolithicus]KAK0785824.1 glycogenin glucosyltransferase [Friedmanniomyces endolithicus]KAK0787706.1 glycogenin glucosyltransferase [Friedmanniomyces endolithicus]KAK0799107.1 glycogenin glucosyltransferase [Friedmanniomyces endolithicus]KAK0839784.1 glycogenin glucosyltransferase [Friedmanniomyces endolithicus]
MAVGEDVYCTLVMTDAYLPGAAVLAHSLRDTGTTHPLVCLTTPSTLLPSTLAALHTLYDHVLPIEPLANPSPANLYLLDRPDLLYTFTKIHLWRLTQFRRIVYLDADIVCLRAPDELFRLPSTSAFAAAPDVGWPDTFNTGLMVLTPHTGTYSALRTLASAGDSFDGADQGLLNQYFAHRGWERLSFVYNCTPAAGYQYEPAYRYFKSEVRCVHFIGGVKPWQRGKTEVSGGSSTRGGRGVYQELLSRWWAVWEAHFPGVSTYDYATMGNKAVEREEASRSLTSTDIPVTDTQPTAEAIAQGNLDPTPTAQQRKFSAPHLEWDATRSAPPSSSKPEAANFPNQIYEFNQDAQSWKAPPSYPEIPRQDLWYDVPMKQREEQKLKAIFPWEERELPKPSRVFADEETFTSSHTHQTEEETERMQEEDEGAEEGETDDFLGGDELAVMGDSTYYRDSDGDREQRPDFNPRAPTLHKKSASAAQGSWDSKNAWDEVSGIEEYVRALTAFQKNKGQVQVLSQEEPGVRIRDHQHHPRHQQQRQQQQQHILSPGNEPDPVELVRTVRERRASLLLTDFPTASERPSLPVTPAPRRRESFWGSEGENVGSGSGSGGGGRDGELAGAEGVPEQSDWNPDEQLEVLRRNSRSLGQGDLKLPGSKLGSKKALPDRKMPGAASATIPEEEDSALNSEGGGAQSASSNLGLDQMSGPLDGTREAEESPSMIEVAAGSGLFGELGVIDGEGEAADGKAVEGAPRFSEVGFGGSKASSGESEGEHTDAGKKDLSPTQTREEEGVAP